MKKIKKNRVIERAKKNSITKKLYSFRLNESVMTNLESEAKKEGLTVTGLIEALIEEYLSQEQKPG